MAIKFLNNVAVDSNVLYVDTVNNRVGIGQEFPSTKLEVAGNTTGTLLTIKSYGGGVNDAAMRFYNENDGPTYTVGLDSSDSKFKIAYSLDGNNLTTGTKLVIDTSGNVGIGTTSPGYKLEVNGDFYANSTGVFDGDIECYGSQIYSTGSLLIESNGTFGGDLTVSGGDIILGGTGRIQGVDTVSAGTDAANKTYVDNAVTGLAEYVAVAGDTMTGNLTIGSGSADNSVTSYYSDGTYTQMRGFGLYMSRISSYIRPVSDNTQTLYIGSATNQWNTIRIDASITRFETNGSERMRITSAGNVGIGTTSPTSKLDVTGGVDATEYLISGDAGMQRQSTHWAFGDNYGSTLGVRLVTDGQDRLSVTTNGKVGIGTTNPASTLDVAGGVKIANDSATASASNVGTLRYRTSGNNSYVDMCMQTGATTYAWVNIVQNNW